MRILAEPIVASGQITLQPCYLVGACAGYENRSLRLYNEGSSTATANLKVLTLSVDATSIPLPGIYCPSGLYAVIDHGDAVVYYYLAE